VSRSGFVRAVWAVCLLLPVIGGCRSVSLHVSDGIEPRPKWTVAVFPFDDRDAEHAAEDHLLFGSTGAQGSGVVVGRALAAALQCADGFDPVSDRATHDLMRRRGLAPPDLAALEDGAACEIGRALGADMLVRGSVRIYRTGWFLFLPRARVSLEIHALDPKVDQILWTARVSDCSHFNSEREMVETLAREVARDAASRLTPP
jgi:hypothetical protein